MTILNADGTVRYNNPTATRLLGYREALPEPGSPGWAERFIHPEDRRRVLSYLARALRTPGVLNTLQYRFKHIDGSWRHLETIANNLLADERVRGVLMISRDITEREEAKERSAVTSVLADLVVGAANIDPANVREAGLADAVRYEVIVTRLQGRGYVLTEQLLADAAHAVHALPGGLCGAFGAFGVLIVPARVPHGTAHPVADRLRDELRKRVNARELRLAVGGARPTTRGIQASFDEAVRLLSLGDRLAIDGVITPRRAVLPSILDDSPRASLSLVRILQPLIDADQRSRADLLATLRCYLDNDASVQKTAETMHAHRNTIRARLRTIESVLGGPVAADRVVLQLALVAHELTARAT